MMPRIKRNKLYYFTKLPQPLGVREVFRRYSKELNLMTKNSYFPAQNILACRPYISKPGFLICFWVRRIGEKKHCRCRNNCSKF